MELKLQDHIRFSDEGVVSEIIHSCQDIRVIILNLSPGQSMPPSICSSSVMLQVLSGRCELLNGMDWLPAEAGTIRFYPPHETNGVRAMTERASVLVIMAPMP